MFAEAGLEPAIYIQVPSTDGLASLLVSPATPLRNAFFQAVQHLLTVHQWSRIVPNPLPTPLPPTSARHAVTGCP